MRELRNVGFFETQLKTIHKLVTQAWHDDQFQIPTLKMGINVSYCLRRRYVILTALVRVGVVAALMLVRTPAFADQFDTVNYIANAGISVDDNIFRLSADVDPQTFLGKPSKSDTTRFVSFGINIDKKYSSQELMFNATGTNFKYSNFPGVNYTSSSFKGAWNWQVSPRLSGALNFDRVQTLNNPADTRVYTRNLNTADNMGFSGNWWVHSSWHLLFGASNGQTTNSVNAINYPSSQTGTNEWGLKYQPVEGKSIALISRNLSGTNFNKIPDPVALIDTGYTEKQLELRAAWQITGKSALSGNLVNTRHRNFNFSQRDYRGMQGGINYALDISGKTFLNMSLQRSMSSWWDFSSSYYAADSISIAPSWQMNSKVVTRMAINRGVNNYRGPVAPGTIARHDVTQSVLLGVDWTPQRAVTFSASVQRSKRSVTPAYYAGYSFDDNTASLSVQAYF